MNYELKIHEKTEEKDALPQKTNVLMICTGGTIGMLNKDNDPSKPLVPASWVEMKSHFSSLKDLPFGVQTAEMELIDSSDMNPDYWIGIAKNIRDNYDKYDGFVILHGTDTMTYTATALSFLLENLTKPVIVTGSQLPLAEPRNDAAQNLVTALVLAASYKVETVPEVCILFNNVLLRGNRSRKVSSSGFAGFNSLNYRPLAEIGEHIKIDTKLLRSVKTDGFFINEILNSNVMIFDIFPGIASDILKHVFAINGLRGVVLRTYGAGNAPTKDIDLLKEIENAIKGSDEKEGIIIVNITQCLQGMVEMGLYDASAKLSQIGVVSGTDMTPEAALVKMMFLLGQYSDTETVKEMMQKNLRGEQSVNVFNFIYKSGETKESYYRLETKNVAAGFVKERIAKANIRIDKLQVRNVQEKENNLVIAIFMNYPVTETNVSTVSINIPQCLGIIKYVAGNQDYVLECTQNVKQVIDPGRPVQLTVVSKGMDVSWESIVFSIYTDV
jgi:L-asparaginase